MADREQEILQVGKSGGKKLVLIKKKPCKVCWYLLREMQDT